MSITEIFNNVKLIQRPPLDRYKTKCMGVTVFTRSGVIVQNRSRLCVASDKPEVSASRERAYLVCSAKTDGEIYLPQITSQPDSRE